MATQQMYGITWMTLGRLVVETDSLVRIEGVAPQEAIRQIVARVPAEVLGALIMEADRFVDPFSVKCRTGIHSRYPDTWEVYLRETLASILEVITSLDWQK